MRVLVACEYSGRVRNAFRALGHDAWSCDFLPAEDNSRFHLQQDVREVLSDEWDMMIAHPDCTYLCSSGLHWNKRVPGREALTEQALEFVQLLIDAPIHRIAIENPIGCIGTRIRKPDQIIQPYQFGEDASKATCLWLKNLSLSYVQLNSSSLDGFAAAFLYPRESASTAVRTAKVTGSRDLAGRIRLTAVRTDLGLQKIGGRSVPVHIKGGRLQWRCSGVV
jgi:hypothetical protein